MAPGQTSILPGWQQEKPPPTGADVVGSERETEIRGLPLRPPAGLLQKEHGPRILGVEGGDSWLQQPGGVRGGGGGGHRGCQLRQVVPSCDFSGECDSIRGRPEEKTGDACSITATGWRSHC